MTLCIGIDLNNKINNSIYKISKYIFSYLSSLYIFNCPNK